VLGNPPFRGAGDPAAVLVWSQIMRSRFLKSVLIGSIGLAAASCAASGDDVGTGLVGKKDSGVDSSSINGKDSGTPPVDSSVTNPPVDTGTPTTLPPPVDTGTPPDDTYVPPADTYEAAVDTYVPPVGGTTGLACTSDAECGSSGDTCIQWQASFCAGMACTNPTNAASSSGYADYSACDSDSGVCSPNTTTNDGTGFCVPKCTVPLGGGSASGCLPGETCTAKLIDASGTSATGSCERDACKADTDCPAGYPKCQKETMNCVDAASYQALSGATGTACSVSAAGTATPNCLCLAASSTTTSKGYCTTACITGDATHGCATGYTCNPRLPTTYFTAVPNGLAGLCVKACTATTGCATGTTCQTFAGGKFCSP
jgi:hypothetical protein